MVAETYIFQMWKAQPLRQLQILSRVSVEITFLVVKNIVSIPYYCVLHTQMPSPLSSLKVDNCTLPEKSQSQFSLRQEGKSTSKSWIQPMHEQSHSYNGARETTCSSKGSDSINKTWFWVGELKTSDLHTMDRTYAFCRLLLINTNYIMGGQLT